MARAYIGMANGSPCVVPSWTQMVLPFINSSDGSLYVLIRIVARGGHNL